MMSFTLMLALLCTFSWISASVSEFHTVEVQPGEEVTLLCSNFSSFPAHIVWFKLANGPNVSRISSMFSSESNTSLFDGFPNSKFKMTSNTTNLFLNIKRVDFSDSGLYFCGNNKEGLSVIFSATYLQVQAVSTNPLIVILGGGTIFLVIIIICLVVRIRTFHTVQSDKQNPQHSEMPSEALNYAAVGFRPKAERSRRPVHDRELEPHVVYAATR
ncbi:uncharacterized protein PAE49_021248 [Odontesthes bonariensis]|uniref:uncharacterized protein LOC142369390 n=1 Tax=Odontesthes bonariensis TaxID=219752 RepID=UPI003F587E29